MYWPERPQTYRTARGETTYYTDEEYSKLAGELALERLEGLNLNYDAPGEREIQVVRKVLTATRKTARTRLGL